MKSKRDYYIAMILGVGLGTWVQDWLYFFLVFIIGLLFIWFDNYLCKKDVKSEEGE